MCSTPPAYLPIPSRCNLYPFPKARPWKSKAVKIVSCALALCISSNPCPPQVKGIGYLEMTWNSYSDALFYLIPHLPTECSCTNDNHSPHLPTKLHSKMEMARERSPLRQRSRSHIISPKLQRLLAPARILLSQFLILARQLRPQPRETLWLQDESLEDNMYFKLTGLTHGSYLTRN